MDYETNLQELIKRMEANLQFAKQIVEKNVIHKVQMISGKLEMLDNVYFQTENGVESLAFAGIAKTTDDEISMQPCLYEANATLQNFQIRSGCFIVGFISFVHLGKGYPMFNIKPYPTDNLSGEFILTATSSSDEFDKTVSLLIKLDSKKRICKIQLQTIKLADFPNVRSEFVSLLNEHMDADHANDVRVLSNNLALKYAMSNIPKINSSNILS